MAATFSYTSAHLSTLVHTIPSSHNNTNNSVTFATPKSSPVLHLRRRTRQLSSSIVTRAGASTSQYIFAFVFPLSLLAITAFTAFQIGNRLDKKFLEELAMNEALREEEEEDDEFGGVATPRKEEPALPRSRNRPRREV